MTGDVGQDAVAFGSSLRAVRVQAGLSLREVESAVGLPKSTIAKMESGASVPDDAWLTAYLKACGAGVAKQRELKAARNRIGRSTGRLVGTWTPAELGVHRAIVAKGAQPDLPPYFARVHDVRLRALGREGVTIVCLVGGSSTGKTRAAYEMVRTLDGWTLHRPIDSAEAEELLRSGLAPRTVLWLDEMQRFLTAQSTVAARLRKLAATRRSGPLLVFGTMWPLHWNDLVRGETQSRQLLQQVVQRIDVAEEFTYDELIRARDFTSDRRWRAAISAGRRVTQTMAGGPELVRRFGESATLVDRRSQALLTVAMDVHRMGRTGLLPLGLLERAAAIYLEPADRVDLDNRWFASALAAASEEWHGVTALRPLRQNAGLGPPDGYELHDYLDQYGRSNRHANPFPPDLWSVTAEFTPGPADRLFWLRARKSPVCCASLFV
jgi:hypothetical protein